MSKVIQHKPSGPFVKGQIVGYVRPRPKGRVARSEYSGFPKWNALRVRPGHEHKSAERLEDLRVYVYLPLFKKSCCRRGGLRERRDCAVMPGLLFVPIEMVDDIDDRDGCFDWAGVHEVLAMLLTKHDVDELRRIEAKLNKPDHPVDAVGREIQIGQAARFVDPRSVRLFGEAAVFEVASFNRIGLEVSGLFGGLTKVYVTADEIEVM